MILKPGTVIGGKYRLTRQLGQGAMGVVWAATNIRVAREVAIKLILGPTEELRVRFLREARACGALKHPNIVEMIDVAETDDGDPFMVMELLTGETVDDLLKRQRRLEQVQAARIARDVALALTAAHGAGIVHRDLKPANIFLHEQLEADGRTTTVVKVVDFGVSKNLAGDSDGVATVTGGLVGSPAYMSPEQVRSQRDIDGRTDLWSLGVLLFHMLSAKRPFDVDPALQLQGVQLQGEVLKMILIKQAPLVSTHVRNLDPGMVQVVARCLERDRDRRVQTATQLVELLTPLCNLPSRRTGEHVVPGAEQMSPTAPPASYGVPPGPASRPGLAPNVPVAAPRPPASSSVDDEVATAMLPPGQFGAVMGAAPPAARAPRAFGGTLPLNQSDEMVRARQEAEAKYGRPQTPSSAGADAVFGARGTMRMSVDFEAPSAPRAPPPAPPPPMEQGSAFNPPSSGSGQPAGGAPSAISGSWPSVTAPLQPGQAVPLRSPSYGAQSIGAPTPSPSAGSSGAWAAVPSQASSSGAWQVAPSATPPIAAPAEASANAALVSSTAPTLELRPKKNQRVVLIATAATLAVACAVGTVLVLRKTSAPDDGGGALASASVSAPAAAASGAPSVMPSGEASAEPSATAAPSGEPAAPPSESAVPSAEPAPPRPPPKVPRASGPMPKAKGQPGASGGKGTGSTKPAPGKKTPYDPGRL